MRMFPLSPASASLHQVSTDSIVVVYSSINGNIDVHPSVCGGRGDMDGCVSGCVVRSLRFSLVHS